MKQHQVIRVFRKFTLGNFIFLLCIYVLIFFSSGEAVFRGGRAMDLEMGLHHGQPDLTRCWICYLGYCTYSAPVASTEWPSNRMISVPSCYWLWEHLLAIKKAAFHSLIDNMTGSLLGLNHGKHSAAEHCSTHANTDNTAGLLLISIFGCFSRVT